MHNYVLSSTLNIDFWTLKHGSKFIKTSLIFGRFPPKLYKLSKLFEFLSVIFLKIDNHRNFQLSLFEMVAIWQDFTGEAKMSHLSRICMVLGNAVSKLVGLLYAFGTMF